MVLTKADLLASLQKEVRILLHLAGKFDAERLAYRPTANQRSGIELLRYLSYMGPQLLTAGKRGAFDREAWKAEIRAADQRNFEETIAVIEKLPETYERLLADMSDSHFRAEMKAFDGSTVSRGMFIVSLVLGGHAAYRTQLFLYLKACGHEHLGTTNLWAGMDMATA